MRVIAGRFRGRRLPARPPSGVRPTSDRVREAIFDMLWNLDAVDGAEVVDLFCGTGAMGIEAWSRGASRVVFVDRDRAALEATGTNCRAVGLDASDAELVRGDLPSWLVGSGPVDLAFCDPPYAFDAWSALLAALSAQVVVCESDREIPMPPHYAIARSRSYGGTLVTVAEHTSQLPVVRPGALHGPEHHRS